MPSLVLTQVLADAEIYRLPRVVAYNRLEARPRTTDFTRSLRAEVRDPLWLLTRQWQFGEFQGEDAASPVTARIAYRHTRTGLVSLRDGDAFRFDPETMPLETRIEREPIPFTLRERAGDRVFSDVLFAMRWGKQLLRLDARRRPRRPLRPVRDALSHSRAAGATSGSHQSRRRRRGSRGPGRVRRQPHCRRCRGVARGRARHARRMARWHSPVATSQR